MRFQENISTAQLEIDRLKALVQSMYHFSHSSIGLLRQQLRSMKDDIGAGKTDFSAELRQIEGAWSSLNSQREIDGREQINRLTVDHELELDDMRKNLTAKDDEIAALKCDNSKLLENLVNTKLENEQSKKQLSNEMDALRARLEELDERAKAFESEKEKAVNEARDTQHREHKTEIESLRCRYKLMANMDRSPSDTSLEKIERPDLAEYERSGGRSTLLASSPKSPTTGQNLYRRILDEKERQLDAYNAQLEAMRQENTRLKEVVQSLTDYEAPVKELTKLKEHIEALQRDKQKLKQKLNEERSRHMEMSTTDK